ncbi:MAG: hypothetical protein RIC24_14405 [Hyphomicrobiales bacterium]|jgi:hypothetical protein
MKHAVRLVAVWTLTFGMQLGPSAAGFWNWDNEDYSVETQIVGQNAQTGALFLANRMVLDQRIEHFVFVDQVGVGDRVRLVFDDTNFLKRVYRLPSEN